MRWSKAETGRLKQITKTKDPGPGAYDLKYTQLSRYKNKNKGFTFSKVDRFNNKKKQKYIMRRIIMELRGNEDEK